MEKVKGIWSAGWKSNIKPQSKAFFLIYTYYDLQAIPISTEYTCLYDQFLTPSFNTVGTIKAYNQAVRQLQVLVGADLTGLESPQPGLTLRRIAWLINAPLTQTYPLILKILAEIHRLLNFNSSLDVVFWSVLIVGSYSLARITNLVKAIKNSFRQQALKRPLVAQPNSPLCPVQAYKLMLEAIPVQKISQTWYYCQRGVKYPSLTHVLKNALKSSLNRQAKIQISIHHTSWGMEGKPLP